MSTHAQWERLNYTPEDFACKCGQCTLGSAARSTQAALLALANDLERASRHLGARIEIVDAYRCNAYNQALKAPTMSRHLFGECALLRVDGWNADELRGYLLALMRMRVVSRGALETVTHLGERVLRYQHPIAWNEQARAA